MVLYLHNRSSQAKLLKIDEAEEVYNVDKNKTNSITKTFFLKHYVDFGYDDCSPENFLLNHF